MLHQEWRALDATTIPQQTTVPAPHLPSAARPVVSDIVGKGSAKAHLHQICAGKRWKSPLFECCSEEGPSHNKLFSFKVVVSNEEGEIIVECVGNPRGSKKAAAEDAAQGAVWCFRHLGITS